MGSIEEFEDSNLAQQSLLLIVQVMASALGALDFTSLTHSEAELVFSKYCSLVLLYSPAMNLQSPMLVPKIFYIRRIYHDPYSLSFHYKTD